MELRPGRLVVFTAGAALYVMAACFWWPTHPLIAGIVGLPVGASLNLVLGALRFRC